VVTPKDIDLKPSNISAPQKLGFGFMGLGQWAIVPSVFNHEDQEEAPDSNKIGPLVAIDYPVDWLTYDKVIINILCPLFTVL
jgi:hypothetical protein